MYPGDPETSSNETRTLLFLSNMSLQGSAWLAVKHTSEGGQNAKRSVHPACIPQKYGTNVKSMISTDPWYMDRTIQSSAAINRTVPEDVVGAGLDPVFRISTFVTVPLQ